MSSYSHVKYFSCFVCTNQTFSYRYFSKIDAKLLREVLDIYQIDFDLFGYDSSKYFKMVQQEKLAGIDSRLDVNNYAKTNSPAFS